MTRPSPYAQIPDAFLAKLRDYQDAFIAEWIPQLAVLEHPVSVLSYRSANFRLTKGLPQATGWYLTHGGHNSVLESIYAGVPMYGISTSVHCNFHGMR